MRLFIGISLSDETTQVLQRFVNHLREDVPHLRWSLPKQWHITVQFLGETNEDRYACVVGQLRAVQAHRVEICLSQSDFFERAGIFHIAVKPTESLIELHRRIGRALWPCGFEPELRPYSPHITLARNRGRSPSSAFKRLRKTVQEQQCPKLPEFTAHEYLLYQSFTEPSGSRYEVRERFTLM